MFFISLGTPSRDVWLFLYGLFLMLMRDIWLFLGGCATVLLRDTLWLML